MAVEATSEPIDDSDMVLPVFRPVRPVQPVQATE
jgi:hypothetical protein